MAVFMTMNELWKRTALGLVFSLLLIHSCHGQEVSSGTQQTEPNNAVNRTALIDPSNNASQSNQTTEFNDTDTDSALFPALRPPADDPVLSVSGSTPTPASNHSNATTHAAISTRPTSSSENLSHAIGTDAQTTRLGEPSTNPSSATVAVAVKTESGQEGKIISGVNKSLTSEDPEEKKEKASGSYGVFWGVLLTGLLLAALILGTFCFKRHRKTNGKGGMKLAEESYMADEENQGNTLVSVAPLNQPEPQEKPSLNGESPEGLITQNPPAATNGHSTTKTADTEL